MNQLPDLSGSRPPDGKVLGASAQLVTFLDARTAKELVIFLLRTIDGATILPAAYTTLLVR